MLVEPAVDGVVVAGALEREYGRNAHAVRFIPAGETAWCFTATDDQRARWFIKLTRPGGLAPARVEFAVAVSRALADLGLPVPRPLATLTGAFGCWLDDLQLVVFEFVDGAPLTEQDLRSPQVMRQVARLVATVHRSTSVLAFPIPFVDTLQVYPDGLRRCLAQLDMDPIDGLVREARELVWPRRADLLGRLQRVWALGDRVRPRPSDRVLCHGDLTTDNLLSDHAGRPWLVDWDAAVFAPPELDVSLFTGAGFARFLDGYRLNGGYRDLDPDRIAFFLLRRNLDDLVDWLQAVLDNQLPEAQRRADLDGVQWCLARWDEIDERLQQTRSTLARRH